MKPFILVALGIVLTTVACDNSSSTSPTTTGPTTTNYPLSGIAPAAVNGVAQPASNNFTVGQTGGTVSVTLTSAVETLVGGTLNPNVQMGIAVGSPSGTVCVVPAGNPPNVGPAGQSISGTLNPGPYCVQVTNEDTSSLSGPVAYSLLVVSP
jgi:hypothetical protein